MWLAKRREKTRRACASAALPPSGEPVMSAANSSIIRRSSA